MPRSDRLPPLCPYCGHPRAEHDHWTGCGRDSEYGLCICPMHADELDKMPRSWRIYRDRTPGVPGSFPWVVECPRLFEVAPYRHTRHREFCSLCDVFPSQASAVRWVSSQIAAGNGRPFSQILAEAGIR